MPSFPFFPLLEWQRGVGPSTCYFKRKYDLISTLVWYMHLKHRSRRQILSVTISIVHAATDSSVENVELSLQLPRLYHKPQFLQRNHTATQHENRYVRIPSYAIKRERKRKFIIAMMIHSQDLIASKRKVSWWETSAINPNIWKGISLNPSD